MPPSPCCSGLPFLVRQTGCGAQSAPARCRRALHRRLALGLLAGALAGAAPASAEQFRYKLRPGQFLRTRISVAGASLTSAGEGEPLRMQFRMQVRQTQRVRALSGGILTLQITDTVQSGKMTAMGRTQDMASRESNTYTVRMSDRGRFLSRSSAGEDSSLPGMEAMDALFGLALPEKDLKPGDTWQERITIRSASGPRAVLLNGKFVGKEAYRGRQCVRFELKLTMALAGRKLDEEQPFPGQQGQVSAAAFVLFDPAAGHEVYSSGSVTVVGRTDLSALAPDAGEVATATKLNYVQVYQEGGSRR